MRKKTNTSNTPLSPVYKITRVHIEKIQSNFYNPNKMSSSQFKLLEESILEDGFTMPIVCFYLKDSDMYEIVDGFHRFLVVKKNKKIREREGGCLPVSVIDKKISERIPSTIRHNLARGSHDLEKTQKIIELLKKYNQSDEEIMKKIGMSADELLKFKQSSGLVSMFDGLDFSQSWKPVFRGRKPSKGYFIL